MPTEASSSTDASEASLSAIPALNLANYDHYNRQALTAPLVVVCYRQNAAAGPLFQKFLSMLVHQILPQMGAHALVRVPIDGDPEFAERFFVTVAESQGRSVDEVRINDFGLIVVGDKGTYLLRDASLSSSEAVEKNLLTFWSDNRAGIVHGKSATGAQGTAARGSSISGTWKQLNWLHKTLIAVVVVGAIGAMFFGEPSKFEIISPILSGKATSADWKAYNQLLAKEAPGSLTYIATEQAKRMAWNPSSIRAYIEAKGENNWVTMTQGVDIESNRQTEVAVSGTVRLQGTNAFGATVVNNFSVSCTLAPSIYPEKKEGFVSCK
jgi:hypothetical protein